MIYFEQLGSLGRLGNQMFQYAALRGLCLKKGYETVLPDLITRRSEGQKSLLPEFNIIENKSNLNIIKHKYIEPDWRKFDPKFFDLPDDTLIHGYFQNLYYFQEYEDVIKKELTPKQKYLDIAKKYINSIKKKYDCEVVSVHVRRGDNMLGINNKHNQVYQSMFDVDGVYFKYFKKAKELFNGKAIKYLIFTGGNRGDENNIGDMEWCKNNFIGDEYLFSENQKQINDFARIMMCDHNIICHISSFGWWAAYQNPNPNKIVVAPEFYHPDEPSLKRDKFYPDSFRLL